MILLHFTIWVASCYSLWPFLPTISVQASSFFGTSTSLRHNRPQNYRHLSYNGIRSIVAQLTTTTEPSILDYHSPDSFLSKILIPRPVESKNLSYCRQLIVDIFEELSTQGSWELESHSFLDQTPHGPKNFTNLIFTHDRYASQRIVLAAHLDSKLFLHEAENQFVGAIDSAAPVAIIIDVVRSISSLLDRQRAKSHSGRPYERVTLQVVLLDGEEAFDSWSRTDSLYGARALAKKWSKEVVPLPQSDGTIQHTRSIDQINAFVLLDLLGQSEPNTVPNLHSQTGWIYDDWQRLEEILSQLGVTSHNPSFFTKRFSAHQAASFALEDDHLPFQQESVPIFHLITVPFPPTWHQLTDNANSLDHQVIKDWSLMTKVWLIEYFGLEEFLDGHQHEHLEDEL